MIGIDTNVLVRYVAQDDAAQSPKATRLIESLTPAAPGYVSLVAILELVWVLTGCYSCERRNVAEVLETLLRTKELVVAEADVVWRAVRLFKSSQADFADCVIERLGNAKGCAYTATFDRGAARDCGMVLIE